MSQTYKLKTKSRGGFDYTYSPKPVEDAALSMLNHQYIVGRIDALSEKYQLFPDEFKIFVIQSVMVVREDGLHSVVDAVKVQHTDMLRFVDPSLEEVVTTVSEP